MKVEDETQKEMKQDSSHGKGNISLVKELTHSGSGGLPESIFALVNLVSPHSVLIDFLPHQIVQ